ncbi:MAG TPA: sigma-70 family RNA polymerase sigma factor [Trebonia sp.]|nr:sigma-70 family RNA polymerase sigma factor [Trebonia sp.]
MRDSEVVASILAGEPGGLAEAYDRYAALLYTYCCTLLREPADAADAVQDTFVIASARLSGLRDPERLRPWLFSVARNECLRRLRDRRSTSAFDEAANMTDETADVGGDAERAELRALLRAALRGMNDGDRDIIALQLSQGLDVAEVAAAMGVTRKAAHALLSRARAQLMAAIGVLLVGRAGRGECPALDSLLAGWDGHLTVLLRKRLNRHIEHCVTCTARRQHELTPAMLLGLTAGPALLGAAAAVRHAAAAGAVTAGLRGQALAAMTAGPADPARQAVLARAGSFSPNGFPRPLSPPAHGPLGSTAARVAAAAGAAAAVAAIVIALVPGGPAPSDLAGGGPAGPGATFPGGAGASNPAGLPAVSPVSSAGPGGRGGPGGTTPAGGSTPGGPVTTGPGGGPGAGGPAPGKRPGGQASSSAPAGGGQPTSGHPGSPSSPPSTGPGGGPTTGTPTSGAPSAPPPTAPPTSAAPPPPPPPAQGTASVSPGTVLLTPLLGATLTITAHGGPVSWSISEPSSLIGKLTLSATAGTLQAGQSATISIRTSLVSLVSSLTVYPGGTGVAVLIGL